MPGLMRTRAVGGSLGKQRVIEAVGGAERARVIVLLALVLALSSADTSAVGAAAAALKVSLHIDFTQIGLLVALPALAAAIATVPIGALTDRVHRVSLLKWSIVVWSLAMIAAGASKSFGMLLVSRLVLGAVTATSGPTLASLIGDFFPSRERGKVYGFILTGDLLGSVIGLFVSGNAAAISWRLAFWVLVIPSAILAWAIWRLLPEPDRGGSSRLAPEDAEPGAAQPAPAGSPGAARSDPAGISGGSAPELERAVRQAGVRPRPENLVNPGAPR